jgi:hypothetical protein
MVVGETMIVLKRYGVAIAYVCFELCWKLASVACNPCWSRASKTSSRISLGRRAKWGDAVEWMGRKRNFLVNRYVGNQQLHEGTHEVKWWPRNSP